MSKDSHKGHYTQKYDYAATLYPHVSNLEAKTEIQDWSRKNGRDVTVSSDPDNQDNLFITCDERTRNQLFNACNDIISSIWHKDDFDAVSAGDKPLKSQAGIAPRPQAQR